MERKKFKNSQNTIHHLFDNIKAQYFSWLKAKHKNLPFDYHLCWTYPLNFLMFLFIFTSEKMECPSFSFFLLR